MIDVSVIIPVYNNASTLRRCLDSVLDQTGVNLEVICIDDASQDDSLALLERYCHTDLRIKLIANKRNLGAAASRNLGLERASGQYLMNLDGDDYLEPDSLQGLLAYSMSDQVDMCFYRARLTYIDETANRHIPTGIVHDYPDLYEGAILLKQFLEVDEFFYYCAMVIYRRAYLQEHRLRYHKLIIGEGGDFILRALIHAERVKVFAQPVYHYCVNSGSVTNSPAYKINLLAGRVVQYASMLRELVWKDIPVVTTFLTRQRRLIAGGIDALDDEAYTSVVQQMPDAFCKQVLATFNAYSRSYGIQFCKRDIGRLYRARHIYLYGAGYAAMETLHALSMLQVKVEAVVVTQQTKTETVLYGHRIMSIGELNAVNTDSLFVICLNQIYVPAVVKTLHDCGFDNYIDLQVRI